MTIYIYMCNIRFDITTRLEKVSIANPYWWIIIIITWTMFSLVFEIVINSHRGNSALGRMMNVVAGSSLTDLYMNTFAVVYCNHMQRWSWWLLIRLSIVTLLWLLSGWSARGELWLLLSGARGIVTCWMCLLLGCWITADWLRVLLSDQHRTGAFVVEC